MAAILLTGGAGYIGSHACVELINAGFDPILFDNLCNSSPVVVDRIETITGKRPQFIEGDVRDREALGRRSVARGGIAPESDNRRSPFTAVEEQPGLTTPSLTRSSCRS